MRLLIILGLIYLIYRMVKTRLLQPNSRQMTGSTRSPETAEDIMIQDPFCRIYFPRREAVSAIVEGKEMLFCSPECRDQYLAARQK